MKKVYNKTIFNEVYEEARVMCYLGIDIGGTFIKYALVNYDYRIIKKWK